jgi:hypothetical protein
LSLSAKSVKVDAATRASSFTQDNLLAQQSSAFLKVSVHLGANPPQFLEFDGPLVKFDFTRQKQGRRFTCQKSYFLRWHFVKDHLIHSPDPKG